jgi:hypothetical protein
MRRVPAPIAPNRRMPEERKDCPPRPSSPCRGGPGLAFPAAFLGIVLVATVGRAADAPPALTALFPAGGGRGATVEVTATGSFARWPVRAWVDEPGVAFEPGSAKGTFTARIDPDAAPGLRLVRVFDERGASVPRPFLVGTLPEVVEREPNDAAEGVREVTGLPVVVNGKLGKRGDVDGVLVALHKGQALVAALEGRRRLGSPMDGVLQVVSADGIVLDQEDDSPGLDPLLVFEAPADGRYLVRVFAFPATPDSQIALAGGDAFLYRLTLTTAGYLDRVLPLAITEGSSAPVEALGWNLPAEARRLPTGPTSRPGRVRAWHPLLAGEVELPLVDHPSLIETEEGSAGEPQAIPVPGSMSGRIEREGDEDRFRFSAPKGRTCRFRVEARALGSPLDPVLRVTDGAGRILAEQDDSGGRDPELAFTAPDAGTFVVIVRDLGGGGGPRCVYRLDATEPTPDFALTVADDRVIAAPGAPAKVVVTVARPGGFAGAVVLEVVGLPDGVKAVCDASEPNGASAKTVTVRLEPAAGSAPFSGPIRILGRSGGRKRVAQATLAGTGLTLEALWLTIPPKSE